VKIQELSWQRDRSLVGILTLLQALAQFAEGFFNDLVVVFSRNREPAEPDARRRRRTNVLRHNQQTRRWKN
jgi:hypothetical protein